MSRSERTKFGMTSCGLAIPRDKGSRRARIGYPRCRLRNAGAFLLGCRLVDRWRDTRHSSFAQGPSPRGQGFRFRAVSVASAPKRFRPSPGTDKRGIKRKRLAKIVNGLLFLALSLIDIAAVVVGKRADGIEPNRRRIILNGRVEFAFCRYARPRLLRATTLPGLSRRASPKSAIARL